MLCTYCNTTRLANTAPCPNCGAPSPLLEGNGGMGNYAAQPRPSQPPSPPPMSWGGPMTPVSWGNGGLASPQNQPLSSPPLSWGGPMTPPAPAPWNNQRPNEGWMDTGGAAQQGPSQSRALVPVNPQMAWGAGAMMPAPPRQDETSLVPAPVQPLPDEGENTIYVPPMYTKPRAIIPRYRAISGLASILIVVIMLCSGASYYAKANGTFCNLLQKWNACGGLPQNLKPTPTTAAGPPNASKYVDPTIINSATTASVIDPKTDFALQSTQFFTAGQTIYVTYSVLPHKTSGLLVIQWYTNDNPYRTTTTSTIPPTPNVYSGATQMVYPQAAAGRADVYWQDQSGKQQLAIQLYFQVA